MRHTAQADHKNAINRRAKITEIISKTFDLLQVSGHDQLNTLDPE